MTSSSTYYATHFESVLGRWGKASVYAKSPEEALRITREEKVILPRRVQVETGETDAKGAPVFLRWARYPMDHKWAAVTNEPDPKVPA